MKNYCQGLNTASDEEKNKLIDEIQPAQGGNKTVFREELAKYPVPLEKVNATADLIARVVRAPKPSKA